MIQISERKTTQILAACRKGIEHIGGSGKECAACGGNGETVEYHRTCGCKGLRKAVTILQKKLKKKEGK